MMLKMVAKSGLRTKFQKGLSIFSLCVFIFLSNTLTASEKEFQIQFGEMYSFVFPAEELMFNFRIDGLAREQGSKRVKSPLQFWGMFAFGPPSLRVETDFEEDKVQRFFGGGKWSKNGKNMTFELNALPLQKKSRSFKITLEVEASNANEIPSIRRVRLSQPRLFLPALKLRSLDFRKALPVNAAFDGSVFEFIPTNEEFWQNYSKGVLKVGHEDMGPFFGLRTFESQGKFLFNIESPFPLDLIQVASVVSGMNGMVKLRDELVTRALSVSVNTDCSETFH